MTVNIAINGFGRIGRLLFRLLSLDPNFRVVAINDLVPSGNLAYLLRYDTVHGCYSLPIEAKPGELFVNGQKTVVLTERDPAHLPWSESDLGIDYVVESTGLFRTTESAGKHLSAGAKRVLVTAPGKDSMPTFVMGVNHQEYDPTVHRVLSNASCTTNCLAPIAKVLDDSFGIEEGLMTTVHAVTATQPVVDGPSKKDWRGGRAACYNIIPAATGAAKAVGQCLPQLQGKLTGMAFRVPVVNVSAVDLTVRFSSSTPSYKEVCAKLKEASEGSLQGILGYTEDEVVSSDFTGDPRSSIFDPGAGMQLGNSNFFKLVSWYDNEWGYVSRLKDLLGHMASKER
ncbi:MAG: type I glyceraldehyde-3-phosphate dehydrogenase [Chlamydiota bacterium]